jgi:hypothetical protein
MFGIGARYYRLAGRWLRVRSPAGVACCCTCVVNPDGVIDHVYAPNLDAGIAQGMRHPPYPGTAGRTPALPGAPCHPNLNNTPYPPRG